MRTIKLTHDEIITIKTALQYVYDRKVELINQNRVILSIEVKDEIFKSATNFLNTQDVFDGNRDV